MLKVVQNRLFWYVHTFRIDIKLTIFLNLNQIQHDIFYNKGS